MAEVMDSISLRVSDLVVLLDARNTGINMLPPPSYTKFIDKRITGNKNAFKANADLFLRVCTQPSPKAELLSTPLCRTEFWELWLDENGRYIFVSTRHPPLSWVIIDPDFSNGLVFIDTPKRDKESIYPIHNLDFRIFTNWLAEFGDLILHAAGIEADGKGYCFAGHFGAGKSTLAASLIDNSSITVLGEDQVILRYLKNKFWIYGTPWHSNPRMCSPNGVPLNKLFFLERNSGQLVEPISTMEGITRILQTAFIPYYRSKVVPFILDRLILLSEKIPFYRFGYRLGSDILQLISQI
jgi:hypothetical protein